VIERIAHEQETTAFERSPFGSMAASNVRSARWQGPELKAAAFPVFTTLNEQGATDYLARLVAFENTEAPALLGAAISFATDREGGFSEEDVACLDSLIPTLSLAAYRIALLDLTIGVLDAYVGLSAGRRVLSGEIHRGAGQTIGAVLFFGDLRGFTPLADAARDDLISRLSEHLEAMAEPIEAHGGEVLNFLGDGLLAIFPVAAGATLDRAASSAVDAALAALAGNVAVNERHAGSPSLALDIALHCGAVFFGNIGSRTRLDFTVIGPAVNEASRMEGLCAALGQNLLLSAPVAAACGRPVASLGFHRIRGLDAKREMFTLADGAAREQ
jgi:adenylate cyclase